MAKRSRYLVALDAQIEAAEARIAAADVEIKFATKRREDAIGVWHGLVAARDQIEHQGPRPKREPITPFLPAPAPEVPTQPVSLGVDLLRDGGGDAPALASERTAAPDNPAQPPGADNREAGPAQESFPDVPAFLQRQTNPAAIPGDGNTPHHAANSEGVQ